MYYKAKRMALTNNMNYHLAAIVWRNRKPITIRTNTIKGHPKCVRTLPSGNVTSSMHAEMNALRFSKPGDDIEVLRFGNEGDLLCSKPCPMCHSALVAAGIRSVTYVGWDGKKHKYNI